MSCLLGKVLPLNLTLCITYGPALGGRKSVCRLLPPHAALMTSTGSASAASMVRPKVNSGPILSPGLVGVQAPHGPVACRQFAGDFEILFAIAREIRNPSAFAHRRLPVGTPHHFQQRRGRRIVADVVKGLDTRRPFHVGLARENEDFQWLRSRSGAGGCQHSGQKECVNQLKCVLHSRTRVRLVYSLVTWRADDGNIAHLHALGRRDDRARMTAARDLISSESTVETG